MNWTPAWNDLDPTQKGIINDYVEGRNTGNSWVLGYPGSGKSIILVYVIKGLQAKYPDRSMAVVSFTKALGNLFHTGLDEQGVSTSGIDFLTHYELDRSGRSYDYIFCDEIQDMTESKLTMIRSRARRFVLAAGDTNQSIFACDPQTREVTVIGDQPASALNAQKKELNIVYRLTQSIIGAIKHLIPTMARDWRAMDNLQKPNVQIMLRKMADSRKEAKYIFDDASERCSNDERCVVLLPVHKDILAFVNDVLANKGKSPWTPVNDQWGKPDYNALNSYLDKCGVKLMYIGNGYGDLRKAERESKVVIMTYFSSKGLDFQNVYMPRANRGMFITYDQERSRTAFMVAMTRSSLRLVISYTTAPCEFVNSFRSDCVFVDGTQVQQTQGGQNRGNKLAGIF